MPIEGGLSDAVRIVATVPTIILIGLMLRIFWLGVNPHEVSHSPFAQRQEQTGVKWGFAAAASELLGGVAAALTGLATYFFLAFCVVVSTPVVTILTGTTPSYEQLLFASAAFAVVVTFALQAPAAWRFRQFIAWGK